MFIEVAEALTVCVDTAGNPYGFSGGSWDGCPPPFNIRSLSFAEDWKVWYVAGTAQGDNPVLYAVHIAVAGTPAGLNGLQVSAGPDGEAWVLQSSGDLWRWDILSQTFQEQAKSPVPFTRLAVAGFAVQWAVDAASNLWQRSQDSGTWTQITGAPQGRPIVDIDVNRLGVVFVVTADGAAYFFTGEEQVWMQTGDKAVLLKTISVLDDVRAWAVTQAGEPIYIGTSSPQAEGRQIAPGELGWDTQSVFDETRSTHLYLVNRAAQLAATGPEPASGIIVPNLQPMVSPPNAGVFRTSMCQGLYDADFLSAYNNPNWFGQATWKSHFYDQSTGRNWEGETEPTALSNGVLFVARSVAAMRQAVPDLQVAGYNLGLALHYFTDLTQPMHSGNYTYLSSIPWGYHTNFEEYAMAVQAQLNPQPTVVGFVPGGVKYPRDLYTNASQYFKDTYFAPVVNAIDYYTWKVSPSQWQATVLALLPGMFDDSVKQTAQLIYLWATLVQAPHEDGEREAVGVG